MSSGHVTTQRSMDQKKKGRRRWRRLPQPQTSLHLPPHPRTPAAAAPCSIGHACMAMAMAAAAQMQAAARIPAGRPAAFESSKLKVEFVGDGVNDTPLCALPRAYALTHCDFTATLTLAVSNAMSGSHQLRRWQRALHRDSVVAEWKEAAGLHHLHVHCDVGLGGRLTPLHRLAAAFRYRVFSKELPLASSFLAILILSLSNSPARRLLVAQVLEAVMHGDAALFAERPELAEAAVWVYFHSTADCEYNRVECWGSLRDAAAAKRLRRWRRSPSNVGGVVLALLINLLLYQQMM